MSVKKPHRVEVGAVRPETDCDWISIERDTIDE
jgi:hypothetical protein